jgi:hypothetical protein
VTPGPREHGNDETSVHDGTLAKSAAGRDAHRTPDLALDGKHAALPVNEDRDRADDTADPHRHVREAELLDHESGTRRRAAPRIDFVVNSGRTSWTIPARASRVPTPQNRNHRPNVATIVPASCAGSVVAPKTTGITNVCNRTTTM